MKRGRGRRKSDFAPHPAADPASSTGHRRVSRAESFARDFRSLPKEIQERAERAIRLLASDPSHPSLRTKKMHGVSGVWEASVTMSYRLTYQRTADSIILRRIGTHDILRREKP